jgi:hypothetical protein
MTPSVTGTRKSEAVRLAFLALTVASLAAPAVAREHDQPAASREPDAQDVAMTPLSDLNLAKTEVPPVLLTAMNDPYSSAGLDQCRQIETAIAEIDGVLGPDMDVATGTRQRLSTGRMAKSVVASFIPFRGVLRELSGAAEQERIWNNAIYAGAVRRGFLKGLGQQRGCDYPARPAFARVAVSAPAPAKAKKGRVKVAPAPAPQETAYVSEPVVQRIADR